jgi:hypothetical protein
MSLFRVDVVAHNVRDESRATPPLEALVDTGAELTWLPADRLAVDNVGHRFVSHTTLVASHLG